jgi:CRISPR-associated protein Cmr3
MSEITLKITPIDTYFFGAENINPLNEEANYFLKSNRLPQQSTLLGALRYAILLNADETIFHNNAIMNKEEAAKLIGEQSFKLNATEFKFGKIEKISPVFLIKNNQKYIPCPIISKDDIAELKNNNAFIKNYDAKKVYDTYYTNGTEYELEENIFKEIFQVQNFKEKQNRKQNNMEVKAKDKEDAFFKTQFYALAKEWAFGITVKIENETLLPESFQMKMGGENKLFDFEKTNIISQPKPLEKFASHNFHSLIFISDAYTNQYEPLFDFGILETIPFRYLSSTVKKTEKYCNRSKTDEKELLQSGLVELIKKGSIFYFSNKEKLTAFEKLFENDYLKNAGFNHYITIEQTKN